jgi:hypothetical protein
VLVFDSDAHPVTPDIRPLLLPLIAEHDAVLAAQFPTGPESHPCFMAFGPRVPRDRLFFDEEQLEIGTDTGRRISAQVAALDFDVHLLRPEPAFSGMWGTFFLQRTIYHHGSGSFQYSESPRLTGQWATWKRREGLVRRRVFAHHYELSPAERTFWATSLAVGAARRRAIATAASMRRR